VGKRLVAIYSVLVVAIVLLAVFVPGCDGTKVIVKATLCGDHLWEGAVNYTLTLAGVPSPINGTAVPTTYSNAVPGSWTCAYVSGGPPGAYLVDITPATQTVSEGGTITFFLNFELNQDAGIEFLTWTVDGEPVQGSENLTSANVTPCQIIDVHFQQWVNGCERYAVNVTETSWLSITQTGGNPGVQIFVVNDWCAVNKTPAPLQKFFQEPSVNNVTVSQNYSVSLALNVSTLLDVETAWQLRKGTNYTKTINWFGISEKEPMPHECVLFELVVPGPGQYMFILQTSASVALVDDVDVNHGNDQAMSPPLTLIVNVPP
jgi:hypothetical protein